MRLFALFLVALFASVSQAQTNYTSAIITSPTRWTKSMSPITVTSRIDVKSQLTIDPGVVVKLGPSAQILFWYGSQSQLLVNGTASEPVAIMAATNAPWSGFIQAGGYTTRPIIRANFALITGLGARVNNITPYNLDYRFSDCLIESTATVPAGLNGAGSAVNLLGYSTTMLGYFERCLIRGQTYGPLINATTAVIDCDFENVVEPVRFSQTLPTRFNITAAPY